MKLSEAIVLGDALKKANPGVWLSEDGSCGCAFGGALIALGLADAYMEERDRTNEGFCLEPYESEVVKTAFPWLTRVMLGEISILYCKVRSGEATIEDVAAYIGTVEPVPTLEPTTSEAVTV